MATKTYTITLAARETFDRLMQGLNGWHVDPKTYTASRDALAVITTNANVVDVCTEEINPTRYTITSEKRKAKGMTT